MLSTKCRESVSTFNPEHSEKGEAKFTTSKCYMTHLRMECF